MVALYVGRSTVVSVETLGSLPARASMRVKISKYGKLDLARLEETPDQKANHGSLG